MTNDTASPAADVRLLHHDDDLVAVYKPSGLLVHRGWGADRETLLGLVRDRLGQRVHPLHRIDRGTSGIVLFALHHDAAHAFGEALGAADKRYLALVRGIPSPFAIVDHPVRRGEEGPRVSAVTSLRTIAVSPRARCSLIEARPHTGRTHQIRRHLKHLSHPIIGDVRYGKGTLNREFRASWGIHRLALHAWAIDIAHPTTGERLRIRAELPDDLGRAFTALELPTMLPEEEWVRLTMSPAAARS